MLLQQLVQAAFRMETSNPLFPALQLVTLMYPLRATAFIPDTPNSIYRLLSPCLPAWFDLLYHCFLLSFSPTFFPLCANSSSAQSAAPSRVLGWAAAAIRECLEGAEQQGLPHGIWRCTVFITLTGLPGRKGAEAEHSGWRSLGSRWVPVLNVLFSTWKTIFCRERAGRLLLEWAQSSGKDEMPTASKCLGIFTSLGWLDKNSSPSKRNCRKPLSFVSLPQKSSGWFDDLHKYANGNQTWGVQLVYGTAFFLFVFYMLCVQSKEIFSVFKLHMVIELSRDQNSGRHILIPHFLV